MINRILKKITTLTTALGLTAALGVTGNVHAFDDLNNLTYIDEYKNTWEAAPKYTGGWGGNAFDDMSTIKQWDPWVKPIMIHIRAGERLDRLQIHYGYSEADYLNKVVHGGSGGDPNTFHLQDNEFIERVDVCATNINPTKGRVGKIRFLTTHQDKTFGETCKHNSRIYDAPDGWHIIGFKGRKGSEINQLQAIYAPKLKLEVTVNVGSFTNLSNPQVIEQSRLTFKNLNSTVLNYKDTYSVTQGETLSASWSNTVKFSLGFSLKHAATVGATNGPFSASSTIESTISTEFVEEFQHGKSNTTNYTSIDSDTISIDVAPYTFVVARISRTEANATAPMNIIYTNVYTGTQHKSEGSVSKFDYSQTDVIVEKVGDIISNIIMLDSWYVNDPLYSCYHGKSISQASTCY